MSEMGRFGYLRRMSKILGISAFYHDAAAALTIDGEVIAAAQEERFTREKHTARFPVEAVRYCLAESGLTLDDLDAVVFYDKPLLKFERLLHTYYAYAPKGVVSFVKAMPVWLREKLFLRREIRRALAEVMPFNGKRLNLLFSEHHLSHAASAFYASPFTEAAILTVDGVGEWSTASIAVGRGNRIEMLRELHFPHSLGLLYSAFTYYLGFTVNSGEYKLMGLAPYGHPNSAQTARFEAIIRSALVRIDDDGGIFLHPSQFTYATGLRMVNDRKWEALFGVPRREPNDEVTQVHCDLALAIQRVTEDIVLRLARTACAETRLRQLCLAGGVALNCVANGRLLREKIADALYIQPASGDAGGALGAAWAVEYMHFGGERTPQTPDSMQGAYLGPAFDDADFERLERRFGAVSTRLTDDDLYAATASALAAGEVVGWFQGRMEFGPRALGNRSILADPRDPDMQRRLNVKTKFREGFRPFAPAVTEEAASAFFELDVASPYMLLVAPVAANCRTEVPDNYEALPMRDRLYHRRSILPAVTHLDFSARVQTVNAAAQPRFHALLKAFEAQTGCAVLVNTSFNVRGEPIVCTPFDAYRCFMATDMDVLVLGNRLYRKASQPDATSPEKWRQSFKPD